MIVTRREFLALAAAAPAIGQTPAQSLPGRYPLKLGDDRDGFVYVPKTYDARTPLPLLVMLHGAGNTSLSVQYALPLADDLGVIVLAPDSRDERTWDGVLRSWGPDVEFISAALHQTTARYRVDRKRIGVGGFSDGATYAISLGLINGDLAQSIVAFSPGFVISGETHGQPRIFISHGNHDHILPIDRCGRRIAANLKAAGYDVTFREFDGDHEIPADVARDALSWMAKAR